MLHFDTAYRKKLLIVRALGPEIIIHAKGGDSLEREEHRNEQKTRRAATKTLRCRKNYTERKVLKPTNGGALRGGELYTRVKREPAFLSFRTQSSL